jgi:transposase
LRYLGNQQGVAQRFADPAARLTIEADLQMINALTQTISTLEKQLMELARLENPGMFYRLKSVPGIGDILALVILYEIGDIRRFARVRDFLSYCRLVPGLHESAGKRYGSPGRKIGNANLKWAFSEAVALMLREYNDAKSAFAQLEKHHGRGKASSILAARLGRSVYLILKRGDMFDAMLYIHLAVRRGWGSNCAFKMMKR